ncbi:hypothetical protein PCASD_04317 [Puccinia coronata f. sp. avenae]|uniref:Uncharacterized protein n=1 Tax=Puccinia coronata f. sp. avenae TaxID=200324 RepID=A0A2N5VCQ1_9BASI|nr:hypothetical protein PCASD_04317 [Puccinia coronata f. sp. avenae]
MFYNSSRNPQQDPSVQLSVAICCLGSNGNRAAVFRLKNIFHVGYGTINLYTTWVTKVIDQMRSRLASWPTTAEQLESSQVMQEDGFPGCPAHCPLPSCSPLAAHQQTLPAACPVPAALAAAHFLPCTCHCPLSAAADCCPPLPLPPTAAHHCRCPLAAPTCSLAATSALWLPPLSSSCPHICLSRLLPLAAIACPLAASAALWLPLLCSSCLFASALCLPPPAL